MVGLQQQKLVENTKQPHSFVSSFGPIAGTCCSVTVSSLLDARFRVHPSDVDVFRGSEFITYCSPCS
ncbi:uncharacterized protein YALI1_E00659g [Yarrowia lipolytica]|uniref:Uncharacterized protein n=1 Tax=Yarrowia lipolytica TaxID=4952 RepID=A0A1D8NGJ2_YARLL|nr:hypothetical protein YALI1_E00659g [Yarrowia lipolytica]